MMSEGLHPQSLIPVVREYAGDVSAHRTGVDARFGIQNSGSTLHPCKHPTP